MERFWDRAVFAGNDLIFRITAKTENSAMLDFMKLSKERWHYAGDRFQDLTDLLSEGLQSDSAKSFVNSLKDVFRDIVLCFQNLIISFFEKIRCGSAQRFMNVLNDAIGYIGMRFRDFINLFEKVLWN